MAIVKTMINELINIRLVFSGLHAHTSNTKELIIDTDEPLETPKSSEDKKNLRSDIMLIEGDYRKAYDDKKQELVELI